MPFIHRNKMLRRPAAHLRRERLRRTSGNMKDVPSDAVLVEAVIPPAPRDYHGVNWAGLRTLYLREVRRFWKVGLQTLAAPVVTSLLYMMVFVVAVGATRQPVAGVNFATFVAPGLIMMSIL